MSFLTVADHDLGAFPFIALAPAVIAVAIAAYTVVGYDYRPVAPPERR